MRAPAQGSDEIVIDASPRAIWVILEDSTRLPEWTTVLTTTGTREAVGAVRECEVDFAGRRGRVVERCVEADLHRRIGWVMDADTFGFSRMLSGFGFSFTLAPAGDSATLVRCETYYRPKALVAKVMNPLVMRRKFRGARRRFLDGLKRVAETGEDGAARGRTATG